MHIVAIGWIYVVLMMSIAEESVVAGIMTFLLYCGAPLAIILTLMRTSRRKRERAAEKFRSDATAGREAPGIEPDASRQDSAPKT
jgi:hypothetical protein